MNSIRQAARRVMQQRAAVLRQQCRPYSGKVLDEEEKAAENQYIRKMEKERLEKLKEAGGSTAESVKQFAADTSTKASEAASATSSNTSIAFWAGVAAVAVGGYFFFFGGSKEKKEDHA